MRTVDQLEERRKWYQDRIHEMQEADASFPDDPIHENDVEKFEQALNYLDRRIADAGGKAV